MNNYQIFFAILGAVLYLIGFVPYVYHIFHGRVVPHAFSWSVGAILLSINTYVLILSQGWSISSMTPAMRTLGFAIGAYLGWRYIRRISINWFDYLCISLAVACILIAYRYGAVHAVIPTIIVDILVLLPTIKKIWNNPDTEDVWTWVCGVFSTLCVLASLPTYTSEVLWFWGYVIFINGSIALLIYRRKIIYHSWSYKITHIYKKYILRN